jgi:DNA-binding beta-propeller fold protein YncE
LRLARRRAAALATALLVASAACASHAVRARLPEGLAWPPGEPRVALVNLIETRRAGPALLSWIAGERNAPLFDRPYGLAWMGDDLVVADPAARRLVRIAASGKVTLSDPDPGFAPLIVASCADGLVASDSESGRVARFDLGLRRVSWLAQGLDRPTGLACDAAAVWVVETGAHRVVVLGRDGSRRLVGGRGTSDGQFNFPVAIARLRNTVLVGDTLNFRVQRLDGTTGRFLGAFGRLGDSAGDTPRLKGIAVDAAGHVWASDAHLDQVSIYTEQGQLLLSLGRSGSAPGEFSLPAGVAAHPDGRVAVADALNRRVQVFRLLPGASARP